MDAILLTGLLTFVFIILPIVLGLLLYIVPKKLGYPRLAKYILIFYSLCIILISSLFIFEDRLFTKSDAKELVDEQGIILLDNFDLIENESMFGIGDYYHTFTLRISNNDKQKAIMNIRNSKNFNTRTCRIQEMSLKEQDLINSKIVDNYETEDSYVREYFKPSEREGYAPIFRSISISKTEDKLVFEDIDD